MNCGRDKDASTKPVGNQKRGREQRGRQRLGNDAEAGPIGRKRSLRGCEGPA